jgi:hypothetical protein
VHYLILRHYVIKLPLDTERSPISQFGLMPDRRLPERELVLGFAFFAPFQT